MKHVISSLLSIFIALGLHAMELGPPVYGYALSGNPGLPVENPLFVAIEANAPPIVIVEYAKQPFFHWFRRSHYVDDAISALHRAVELRNIQAIDALLYAVPALAEERDFRGWTPFGLAKLLPDIRLEQIFMLNQEIMAAETSEARVREIIDTGRKRGIEDEFYLKLSLFQRAAFYGKHEIIKVFLAMNPQFAELPDFSGHIAYDYAASHMKHAVMCLLPQYRPVISDEELAWHLVFFENIQEGDIDAVNKNISRIKNLKYARSEGGLDPLQFAIVVGASQEIISLIFNKQLFVEDKTTTFYHCAVRANNLAAIKTLKKIDKDFQKHITFIEPQGSTPALLARDLGQEYAEIAQYLEDNVVVKSEEESSFLDSLFLTVDSWLSSSK